jgi:hypothetical protein
VEIKVSAVSEPNTVQSCASVDDAVHFYLLQYGDFAGDIDAFVSGCFKAMVIDDSATPTPEVIPRAQSAPPDGPEITSMEALASRPCPVKQVLNHFSFSIESPR